MNLRLRFSQRCLSLPAASLVLAALLFTGALSAQEPTVSNVQAVQLVGTKLVEITYDLTVPDGGTAIVMLKVSCDGGATFEAVPFASLRGAFGLEEAPGVGKTLVWDAGYPSWEAALHTQVQVEISASADEGIFERMQRVEGGTLAMSMGPVRVDTFWIGKFEVTWGEWKDVRDSAVALGYDLGDVGAGCADDHPVHSVSWYDVLKWSNAKSEIEGLTPVYSVGGAVYRVGDFGGTSHLVEQDLSVLGYRLPLEVEWEFAARGGNETNGYTYAGSDNLDAVGWYWGNSRGAACPSREGRGTWPVGQKASNELGLYDMSGNVAEWCWDYAGSSRRIRGGNAGVGADLCTVSYRGSTVPHPRWVGMGFRLALTVSAYDLAEPSHAARSDSFVVDLRGTSTLANATPLGQGWFWFDWLGAFADLGEGWIYHAEHGWQFVSGESTKSLFFYDAALESWAWASDTVYPWMYWFAPFDTWSLYKRGGKPGNRWFFHDGMDEWQHEIGWGGGGGPGPTNMALVEGGTLALSTEMAIIDTFWIGKYEVTWGEWKDVRDRAVALGYDIGGIGDGCADDHPVHSVSWFDVLKWCNAKSELEDLAPVYTESDSVYRAGQPDHTAISQDLSANGYRLPLEVEWEFAARGGNSSRNYIYAGSNDLDAVGWYRMNSAGAVCDLWEGHGTWPVGQKAANELGLHDMSGNVSEWCWDASDYASSARISRGGSAGSHDLYCTLIYRLHPYSDSRFHTIGFRLARSPD